MIFELYINGDDTGRLMSFQLIAKHLTTLGIPRPADSKNWEKKRGRSRVWESTAVQRIVRAETYCGVWRYGKNIGANGKGGTRPIDDQIAVNVPAIVSREIWDLAQARRAYNSRIAKRRTKRDYLLRGLIFCGCGRHMVGTQGKYYCTGRYHYQDRACKEPLVAGRLVEPITWDYIMSLISSPEQFEQKLRQAQAQEFQNLQPKQIELDHVIALRKDTEEEADDIARAMTKTNGLVASRLEQQAQEVDRRYQALTARMIELQEMLNLQLTDRNIDNLLQFGETVAVGLQNPTFEDKRRWLEILQATVTVTNSIAVVTCRLSSEPINYKLTEYQTC